MYSDENLYDERFVCEQTNLYRFHVVVNLSMMELGSGNDVRTDLNELQLQLRKPVEIVNSFAQ